MEPYQVLILLGVLTIVAFWVLVGVLVSRSISRRGQALQVKTLGPSRQDAGYDQTRQFYDSVGFQPLEEIQDLWPENPCLIMIKTLR